MNPICIPSHYQAVVNNDVEAFDKESAIDIKSMLYVLYHANPELKKLSGYIIPADEYDDEWGRIEFLKSFSDFPTIAPGHYGAIIHFKGKTFHVYYEEGDNLIIGYKETLYSFKNQEGAEDCFDLFNFIFEGVTDYIKDFTTDNLDTVAKLYL